jgi:hypothetical protein
MTQIQGTNVLAPVVPFDTTDTHASHEARYGKGGYRSVADIAERDAIPQLRREAGMLVCVLTDGKVWKLGDNLTTWTEFAVSSDWATLSGKPSTFPPSSHTHTTSQITDFASAVAAAATPTSDASLLTSGTLSAARLPATVVLTNDGRLSDARTPTAHSHAVSDVSGLQTALDGKQVSGSYAAASHTHTAGQVSGLATVATTGAYADLSGKPTLFSGSYADLTSVPSTFTPTIHAHSAADITSGTIATARLASGTAGSTTYLRGDQTWATVAAGSSSASDLTSGTLSQARLDFIPIHPFLLMGG